MLQFLCIYGKNECDSVIRKIVLDSLQKFYSETWSATIKLIHKNNETVSPFIEKRIKKVFYLILNAFCLFLFPQEDLRLGAHQLPLSSFFL